MKHNVMNEYCGVFDQENCQQISSKFQIDLKIAQKLHKLFKIQLIHQIKRGKVHLLQELFAFFGLVSNEQLTSLCFSKYRIPIV